MATIRIAVADDHQVVRHGLRLSLELEPDMVVVGEARTGAEAIRVAGETQPDVMLLDVRLGDIDGPEVCHRVLLASAKTAVVMLTNYQQDELILRSLLAGAKGYVIKDVDNQAASLSETDLAIVRYLSVGLTNKEIGTRINLSPHTVKDHVEKMCEILGVRSRIELVVEALRRGLI